MHFIFSDKDRGEILTATVFQGKTATDADPGFVPCFKGRWHDLPLRITHVFSKIGVPAEPVLGQWIWIVRLDHQIEVESLELLQGIPVYRKPLRFRQEQPHEIIRCVTHPDEPLFPKEQPDTSRCMAREMDDFKYSSAKIEPITFCNTDHGRTASVEIRFPVELRRQLSAGQFLSP